jgi:hypothetical protein
MSVGSFSTWALRAVLVGLALCIVAIGVIAATTDWSRTVDLGDGLVAHCDWLGTGTRETPEGTLDERHPRCPDALKRLFAMFWFGLLAAGLVPAAVVLEAGRQRRAERAASPG